MKVLVISDAYILMPNKAHENFTKTDEVVKKDTVLNGRILNIDGKRKGEDFTYRLFQTEKGNLIFQNKTKPIMNTEVSLGANGLKAATPRKTEIKMPSKAIDKAHIIGAVAGSVGGFFLAKKMKKTGRTPYYFAIGGAAAGYVIGRLIAGKPIIDVSSPAIIEKS
jgi:hypothetical protein